MANPDPTSEVKVEIIDCAVCGRLIGVVPVGILDTSEMVLCDSCRGRVNIQREASDQPIPSHPTSRGSPVPQ